MNMRNKSNYSNGDCFAVPLRKGGYGVGIAVRNNGRGTVLGYFFGPKYENLPTIADVQSVQPEQAVLVCQFGDLGLLDGGWPIVGRLPSWSPNLWNVPDFARVSGVDDELAWKVQRSDELSLISEDRISPKLAKLLPSDGLFSAGAVEIRLTKLLA